MNCFGVHTFSLPHIGCFMQVKSGKLDLKMDLSEITNFLIASKKGLLAADESTETIKKRFAKVGLESTPELNRKYRQMLITTPQINQYLSGIIMFDETVRQSTDEGILLPNYIANQGIIPGIKVDEGRDPYGDKEDLSKGLEGLSKRLEEYKKIGLKFSKWRAAFYISKNTPSRQVIEENSKRMAQFARLSQDAGFVPIIEPEVVRDGDHDLASCEDVTQRVLRATFSEIEKKGIDYKEMLLKTNMVTNGKESLKKASPVEVAEASLRVLAKVLPEKLPGVVFLSGGQGPDEATENLNAINVLAKSQGIIWQLSFSFARALQAEALQVWAGQDENVKIAQDAFLGRVKRVSLARQGEYKP